MYSKPNEVLNLEGIKRLDLIHSGKANDVFATSNAFIYEIESTDRVSAGTAPRRM